MAIYIHGMGHVKALDAEEKRFALSGDGLFKDTGCQYFSTLLRYSSFGARRFHS
jgi:hypothetical protein